MNQRKLISSAAAAAVVLPGLACRVSAATTTIGTQHFADGQTVGSGTFIGAVSGQPAPFDQFYGGDVAGPDFDATWTFNYALPPTIFSATLTIGLYDGDFTAAGSQLSLLTLDGNVLTTAAGAIFEAGAGGSGQYGVYTLTLPGSVFSSLTDGSATVHLTLTGPGLGVLGATTNNGAGLDFATLNIQEVPEAATSLMAAAATLVVARRRREARA